MEDVWPSGVLGGRVSTSYKEGCIEKNIEIENWDECIYVVMEN